MRKSSLGLEAEDIRPFLSGGKRMRVVTSVFGARKWPWFSQGRTDGATQGFARAYFVFRAFSDALLDPLRNATTCLPTHQ